MYKNFLGTLPLVGTEVAAHWDNLYSFLFWLSVFFFLLVVGGMIVFAIQYRSRPGLKTKYITGSHMLEAMFVAIPTILLMVIFGWGWHVYRMQVQPPTDAMEIHVIGKQWQWTFQYDDGRTTFSKFYAPVNKPVKLVMTSEDVLHSMFIPNFRIKQDVVPGMYTSVWFEATVPGRHQVFCTEYCGTSHSGMLAQAIVLTDEQWAAWKHGKDPGNIPRADGLEDEITTQAAAPSTGGASLVEQGKKLTETKGCIACHSDDGTRRVGPSHKGIWGKTEELEGGSTVTVDENYVRESIENPTAKVVKGYPPSMPVFKGQISEQEMNALIAYIKSLK